jgi:hypothetical protein
MPKESTKVSKSKEVADVDVEVDDSNEESNFVHINDFDVDKVTLPAIDEKRSSDSRFHSFPTYDYGGKHQDKITIVTDEIKLTKGGIPKLDDKWRKNDSKREFFWLGWDKEQEACNVLFEKLKQLDEKFDSQISYDSDEKVDHNLETKTVHTLKDKKKEPLTVLEYVPIVRMSVQGGDGEKKADQPEYTPYERIKVKFLKKWDPKKQEGDLSELTTLLYLGENEEAENLTYPSDFEKYLRWNCTAKFVLQVTKFGCKKAVTKDKKGKQEPRECGFDISVVQVAITKEAPSSGTSADKYRKRMFPKLNSVPTTKVAEQKEHAEKAEQKEKGSKKKDESSDESSEDSDGSDGSEDSEGSNDSKDSKASTKSKSSESEEQEKSKAKKAEVKSDKKQPEKQTDKKQEKQSDKKTDKKADIKKKVDSDSESGSGSESEKSDSEDSSSEDEKAKAKSKSKKSSR